MVFVIKKAASHNFAYRFGNVLKSPNLWIDKNQLIEGWIGNIDDEMAAFDYQ